MELFKAIHTRRSIRKYQDKDVPNELIEILLAAAMMAPSAADARPWQFIVIRDPEIKNQIKNVHPYVAMITQAPLGILICGDLSKEKFAGYWVQDCSAAMQNLLLAAHAKGLGAVWTGIHPMKERETQFKEICQLPDHIIPLGLAVIGWPYQAPRTENRYSKSCIHYDHWQHNDS